MVPEGQDGDAETCVAGAAASLLSCGDFTRPESFIQLLFLEASFTLRPPFFFLPLVSSWKIPARKGIRIVNNCHSSASLPDLNCCRFFPLCRILLIVPFRRSNFPEAGSMHKQCTMQPGWIISPVQDNSPPPITSSILAPSYFIIL
jgi:hypothetical protein